MPAPRFEPLGTDRFPLGEGPFRVRGLAFASALKLVDTRFPGGRPGFLKALGPGDPFAPYYDQIFLVTGDYDVSPLLRLYNIVSAHLGIPVGRFIEERSRWSAESTTKGLWRPMLKQSSPEAMAESTNLAFNRFFSPSRADKVECRAGYFMGELTKLPACMAGLFMSSTVGFFSEAVEIAGGRNCQVQFEPAESDGTLAGVSLVRARFAATWL
ncbi:MAG: hypothetical protein U0359_06170 [Byssovorax sp.]